MTSRRNSISKIRRLIKVVGYLQTGQGFNTRELSEMCHVSRRQVFRDIKALQESGVPVLYDADRMAYWIAESALLPPTEMTVTEALCALLVMMNVGDAKNGIPFMEPARDVAMKMLSNLPAPLREHIGELPMRVSIQTEPHFPFGDDRTTIESFEKAIRLRHKIRVVYDSMMEERIIRTVISPYNLLYKRRSWYVIGHSSLHRAVRTFHLGRFQETELLKQTFEPPKRFTLDRYFGNAWSLIRERGCRKNVLIRFLPKVAHNVAEIVWHKTQKISWNEDGSLDFRVTVDGLEEISWWILGYGAFAEVIEPPELRTIIAEHIQSLHGLYCQPKRSRKQKSNRSKK